MSTGLETKVSGPFHFWGHPPYCPPIYTDESFAIHAGEPWEDNDARSWNNEHNHFTKAALAWAIASAGSLLAMVDNL
jgi:hypothetical protein